MSSYKLSKVVPDTHTAVVHTFEGGIHGPVVLVTGESCAFISASVRLFVTVLGPVSV